VDAPGGCGRSGVSRFGLPIEAENTHRLPSLSVEKDCGNEQRRGEADDDGVHVELSGVVVDSDSYGRDAVGIVQRAAVNAARKDGDEEAGQRNGGEDGGKVEALAQDGSGQPEERNRGCDDEGPGECLPDEMEPGVPGPQRVGGVGAVEIDEQGREALPGGD